MKNLSLFVTFLITTLNGYCQNNAPIAVNDTLYVTHNDSIGCILLSGSTIASNCSNFIFLSNDSEPDGNFLYLDTAFYNGSGIFSIVTDSITPTLNRSTISYEPPFNFWGTDSVLYVIKDDGIPILYDTATIYFFVKRKEFENIDLNNVNARIETNALFRNSVDGIAAFEVPKGSFRNTIFAANLWLAGRNQDSIYMNSNTFNSALTYGQAGPIMDSVHYNRGYSYDWDRIWKVSNNEINNHLNTWSLPGYQPVEVIADWPAHGDTAKGQAFYLAPFIDNNGDGVYNPFDGDYPKIKGQQAVYFIYNDIREQHNTQRPIQSEVHGMVYAYNCPSDSAINNTVFLDYTIYNRSNLTYDSTYIGAWTDFDVGHAQDDYLGCDVNRSTFYGYNGDAFDEDANGALGYGAHPPAQGVTFLKGAKQDNDGVDNNFGINANETINGFGFGDGIPDNEHWGMEGFMYYSSFPQFAGDGEPINDSDFYNYLHGIWRDGNKMVYGGNGHPLSSGGMTPAKYMYPDNSDTFWYNTNGIVQAPWSEAIVGNPPADRRGVGSTGPFTFEPDSSIEITLAYVFGRDYQTTGNQAGIVVMQERIDSIRSYFLTDFVSPCGGTLSVGEKEGQENSLLGYPNPFTNEISINYELLNSSAILVIYNLIGKKIKTQTITKNITNIDLANQPNGIYFVTITDGANRVSKKVVKQ